jgi:hypothetical protein
MATATAMSLVVIRLEKLPAQGGGTVNYRVLSSDFSSDHSWEEVGRLSIDPATQDFTFVCTGVWEHERVVPPWVYGLPHNEMQHALTGQFAGFGYGAWTGRIRSAARRLIRVGTYPDVA